MTIVLTRSATVADPDFTTFSGYLDSRGLIYHREGPTVPVPPRPVRQDTGQNPNEIRPESGDIFSQGDFRGGMGQEFFHHPGSSPDQVYESVGFDLALPSLRSGWEWGSVAYGGTITGSRDAVATRSDGTLWVGGLTSTNAMRLAVHSGSFPGSFTEVDPYAGEVESACDGRIAALGDDMYAALGTNGIHTNSSGAWAHHNDVDAGRVFALKDRIIATGPFAAGGAGHTSIYEITASGAAPSALKTLSDGMSFRGVFEAGQFIYAIASNEHFTKIYHFGLNDALTALEIKGSTDMPVGTFIRDGRGYLNEAFLVGEQETSAGGSVGTLWKATPNDAGFLRYEVLFQTRSSLTGTSSDAMGSGGIVMSGSDLFATVVRRSDDYFGVLRYNIARGALSLLPAMSATFVSPASLAMVQGRLVAPFDKLYFEKPGTYVDEATLETSVPDWNNAGQKIWSTIELVTDPLESDTKVEIYYSTKHPDQDAWTLVGTHDTLNATSKFIRLTGNIESPIFPIRFKSFANTAQDAAPIIRNFSVRSDPKPETPEWRLTRYPRFMEGDQLPSGEIQYWNPRTTYDSIRDKIGQWVTFTEPGDTYTARLVSISAIRPDAPDYSETEGESDKDVIYAELVLEGTLQ